jgi:hypothetical protein
VATLGISDAAIITPLAQAAVRLASSFNAHQAHSTLMAHAAGVTLDPQTLMRCGAVYKANPHLPPIISSFQREVGTALHAMGYTVEQEVQLLEGLMAADIVATAPSGQRILVEADGPSHFLRILASPGTPGLPTGSTVLRTRVQQKCFEGPILQVPYHEWGALKDKPARQAYLAAHIKAQDAC